MNQPYKYIVNNDVIVPARYVNGTWIATLPQQIYRRDLQRIALQGPASSQVKIYSGAIDPANLRDTTLRGASNTADYSGGPLTVMPGSVVNVVWLPFGVGSFTGTETVSCTFTVQQTG